MSISEVNMEFVTVRICRVIFLVVLLAVYMPGATFIAPGFVLYIFTNTGIYNFVVPASRNVTVDVLIVAGGGGGGIGSSVTYQGIFKNFFSYLQLILI